MWKTQDSPINFLVTGTDEYIDLSKTILTVTGKIVKNDETVLDGANQTSVAPVNNFLHSLFQTSGCLSEWEAGHSGYGYIPIPRLYRNSPQLWTHQQRNLNLPLPCTIKIQQQRWMKPGLLPSSQTINYKAITGANASLKKLYCLERETRGFAKRSHFIQNSKQFVFIGTDFC